MHGWRKYGVSLGHTNSDLHNQLLDQAFAWDEPAEGTSRIISVVGFGPETCGAPRVSTRLAAEPFTGGYVHEAPSGARRLFASTQSRIYSQRWDGGWRLLADNLGGDVTNPGIRFTFAGLLNTVVATNGRDEPQFHILDQAASGCSASSFHPAPQLQERGVTAAGVVVQWNNTLFMADIVQDGVRVGHRVIWCNANSPFEWAISDDSTADQYDLDPGIRILAAAEFSDGLYLFADKSIWRVGSSADSGFVFQRVYRHKEGEGCIEAKHSLVVWRDSALYWGKGTVYAWSPFSPSPEVPEWVDRSTKLIQDSQPDCNLITGCCAEKGRYLLSWPEVAGGLNSKTISWDLEKQAGSVIDYGMTMMLSAKLKPDIEFAWWLVAKGFCTPDEVNETWVPFKEDTREFATIGTAVTSSISVACSNITDEDMRCGDCPEETVFIFGSPVDYALKEFDADYFARDEWVGVQLIGKPYGMRLLTGAMDFGQGEIWKRISSLVLMFDALASDSPRALKLSVGVSGEARDPLNPRCNIAWYNFDPKELSCEPVGNGLFGNDQQQWPMQIEGRYLFLDLVMDPVTGGAVDFAGLTASIQASPATGG